MKCFECGEKLSVWNMIIIINPKKFECDNCNKYISLNKKGVISFYVISFFILAIVGSYLFLFKQHIESVLIQDIVFWGALIIMSVLAFLYINTFETISHAKKK